MLGWATPTEAAAMGAIGTVLMTIFYGSFNLGIMQEAFFKTLQITAMILTILLGGVMFAGVFVALGGISAVQNLLEAAQLGPWATMLILMLIAFIAGFVLYNRYKNNKLNKLKHKVRTLRGLSTEYGPCVDYPLFGSGQGRGGSPTFWAVIADVLFNIMDGHGA